METKPNEQIVEVSIPKGDQKIKVTTSEPREQPLGDVNIYKASKMTAFLSRLIRPINSSTYKSSASNGLLEKYNQEREKIEKEKIETNTLDQLMEQTRLLKELVGEEKPKSSFLGSLLKSLFGGVFKMGKSILMAIGAIAGISKIGSKKRGVKGVGGMAKGLLKKAGVIGLMTSAISGVSDYKDWKGLGDEYKTTLREKITGTIGGIVNGLNSFVKTITLGTVDLFSKDEVFKTIDNITIGISQSLDNILSGFPRIQAGINVFTNGINDLINTATDGLTKVWDWGKEWTRTKTPNENKYVDSMNKRKSIEEEYNASQGWFESDKKYAKRKKELKAKLDKARAEEEKNAKLALEDTDFVSKSPHRYDAESALVKKDNRRYKKEQSVYRDWKDKKDKQQQVVNTINKSISTQANRKINATPIESKQIDKIIESLNVALINNTRKLEEINSQKPTVNAPDIKNVNAPDIKNYDNLDIKNYDHREINKNKINRVTNKKGGSISWRNNNAGNLKYVYNEAVGQGKHQSKRSYADALKSAQAKNKGVLSLDRYGYAVFDTKEHGDIAKAKLLTRKHGNRTIEQMLPKYAIDDYTGKANHKAYAKSIYATAKDRGVTLQGKKIKDMSEKELLALMQGMEKFEGYKKGELLTPTTYAKTTLSKPRVKTVAYNKTTLPIPTMEQEVVKDTLSNKPKKMVVANTEGESIKRLERAIVAMGTAKSPTTKEPKIKEVATEKIVFNTSLKSKEVGV